MAKAAKTEGMSIDRSKYNYGVTKMVDAKTGRIKNRYSNGDAVAQAMMRAADAGIDTAKIAKANKIELKGNGNPGQLRMSLGNIMRGRVRKGESMQIGDQLVKKLDQKIPPPDGVKLAAQKAADAAKAGDRKPVGKPKTAAKTSKPAKASRGKTGRSASRTSGSSSQTGVNATTSPTA